eukprot:6171080-Amphidinium_carterae.1
MIRLRGSTQTAPRACVQLAASARLSRGDPVELTDPSQSDTPQDSTDGSDESWSDWSMLASAADSAGRGRGLELLLGAL